MAIAQADVGLLGRRAVVGATRIHHDGVVADGMHGSASPSCLETMLS